MELNKKKYISNHFSSNLIVILLLLISASATEIVNNEIFISILTIFLGVLFILSKQKIDNIILILILVWILINNASALIFQTMYDNITFLGFIVRFLYPYFALKMVGEQFFHILEKWIFRFSVVTIPFFLLQLFYPQVFDYLKFMNFAIPEQSVRGGWYGIVFMHSSWAGLRNSGFMWEPGGFAFILSIGLILRLIYDRFIFNKKHLLYVVLILTTQSTTGYITLGVFTILFLYNQKQYKKYLMAGIPLLIVLIYFFYDLPFLYPKIQKYIQLQEKLEQYHYVGYKYYKAGRVSIFFVNLKDLLAYPLGYGINWALRTKNYYGETLLGANGFANFFIRWGVFGIYLIFYSFFSFFKNLQKQYYYRGIAFAVLIILLVMSSNPVSRNPIIYAFIFYPFIKWGKRDKKIINTIERST